LKYRTDIDGLRAVAVLPVVLYHFGVPGFPGGFIGVDIFFVISGYLICGLIQADIARGRFSIADFYERRILRILPALVVMLCVAAALAFVFFLPEEMKGFLKSLISAAASVSNMYFAQTAGYFDAEATVKPLLHTWSLGVEEQFYIFAPLLLLLIHHYFPQRLKALFIAIAALSFLFELLLYFRNPTFAFYLMPARAWELALGGLLSVGAIRGPAESRHKQIAGYAGLALVAVCIFLCTPATPLPLITAGAAIGATLIIASSETGLSPAGRFLSSRPLVFVGLISYSLYLWHWPFMVFQRTDLFLLENVPAAVATMALLALSVLAGWLSWKYVETPFRLARTRWPRMRVFAGAGMTLAAVIALSVGGLVLHGVPGRFAGRVVRIGSYLAYDEAPAFRTGRCFIDTNRQQFDAENCLKMDAHKPNYLLLGDSHAAHLWLGLSQALPAVNLLQANASVCRPVILPAGLLDNGFCPRMRHLIFDDFLVRHRPDRVILSATWKAEDVAPLLHTLDVLKARGIAVTVLGPIVEYEQPLPRILADEIRYGMPRLPARLQDPLIPPLDGRMHDLVTAKGVTYVSVYQALCGSGSCQTFAPDDVPLQFDTGHLTAQGSRLVGRRIVEGQKLLLAAAGQP
jgi:peptidoglycan/LPS O-acetylase OafA/YrhL